MSLLITYQIRYNLANEEYISRIEPVKKVIREIDKNNTIIITSKPLMFQIYGAGDLRIIDTFSIGTSIPIKTVDQLVAKENVVYLQKRNDTEEADRQRYFFQYQYLDSKSKVVVSMSENLIIYRLVQ